jgi:hypothetical protein
MRIKKLYFLGPVGVGILLLIGMLLLWPAPAVNAQCGSQASSCKNCHETQGQDPVNADGTGWHQSHAFGDFCYLCHAGNNQSMDQNEAHAGMVAPLSDVQAGCASCHPGDLMDRANVYAGILGVEIGAGGGTTGAPASGGGGEGESPSSPPSEPAEPAAPAMVVESSDVVDYSQVYDETVLGKMTLNWGNLILWLIILGVVVGGGIFVYWNERKLRGLPLMPGQTGKTEDLIVEVPQVEGYSCEVTSLLPLIAQLNPVGLHALKRILENPDQANEMLHSLSQLDPQLVQRLRALDRDSRALLMAVAGD